MVSTLQKEITQTLDGMSDDSLSFILDMIRRYVLPAESQRKTGSSVTASSKGKRRLGCMEGQKFIADGYDIDECNGEIAELFGVNGG